MRKHLILTTAVIGLMCGPAFAQDTAKPSAAGKAGFVSEQQSSEWMGSNLIGSSVYGPDDKSIGDISDLLLDPSGNTKAAIIGVGGFLGVGKKDVAIPFSELKITRKDNGKVDKIMLSMTKDDLKNAPTFMTLNEKQRADRTTTSATGSSNPNAPAKSPSKP